MFCLADKRKRQMKIQFKAFAQFSLVALLAAACSSDPDSPGLEYMPDMYRSPAIEPYVDYGEVRGQINDDLKMKRSALVPPSYTIPYYGTDSETVHLMLPYWRKPGNAFGKSHGLFHLDLSTDANVDAEYLAAAADVNPYKLKDAKTAEKIFADGKAIYTANCQHCHGEKGDGNGPMVVSGAYAGVPNYKNLTISEGQMFYSIYYGKGAMGAHHMMLNKKEIWTLVHYVRKFQDSSYGTFDASGKLVASATAAPAADTTMKK